jgi:hypothetical protein
MGFIIEQPSYQRFLLRFLVLLNQSREKDPVPKEDPGSATSAAQPRLTIFPNPRAGKTR